MRLGSSSIPIEEPTARNMLSIAIRVLKSL